MRAAFTAGLHWSGLFVSALIGLTAGPVLAQMPIPTAPPPMDGKALFLGQCGTCHSLDPNDPPRQGPLLKGVVGRKAGTLPGYKYTPGLVKAGWVWDPARINTWITDPQAMVPDATMLYHQADPAVRLKIIDFLKEQH